MHLFLVPKLFLKFLLPSHPESPNNKLKLTGEKIASLVVSDVKIVEKEYEVSVPKYVTKIVKVPKFVEEEITVKNVKVENETVKTQNVVVEEKVVRIEKIKFIDKTIINPILKDVIIEKPIIQEVRKPVEVEKVVEKIKIVEKIVEVPKYVLVEEVVKVPKIQYIPTRVERVVWVDIERQRCKECGRVVD